MLFSFVYAKVVGCYGRTKKKKKEEEEEEEEEEGYEFKLESITTYHLGCAVKMLWM